MLRAIKNTISLIFLLCAGSYRISAQENSREIVPQSPQEQLENSIIPGAQAYENGKIMACAGNAANDNFANAQSLTVNGGTVAGTTCGTLQGGETTACYPAGTASVWYKFTATSTTQYVFIDYVSGGCYFGSAIYGNTSLPTTNCGNNGPISCQSASGGPYTHIYQLTGLIVSNTYYIQILYNPGGICGSNGTFNIGVTTANPGGTITNKPLINTCSSPGAGCFFNSPPTVGTVTSSCTSYSLTGSGYNANSVWSTVVQFTSSASWSNFSWQAIITSNCVGGNVVWFNWTLYDCSCNQLACGDINTLTGAGLACGVCYRILYQMELANCSSFTTIWPYQNVPSSPIPCTVLPLNLLYFTAYPEKDRKGVMVEWESISENNISEYRIERSDDGVNYKTIATAKAEAKQNEGRKYQYLDNCCNSTETRYYKLSAVEKDGSVSFEKIVAVTFNGEKELIKFAPNPASEDFVVSFGEAALNQNTTIQVVNAMGQIVKEENFTTNSFFRKINVVDLPEGLYYIQVITPVSQEPIKYKLIKQ